MASITRKFTYSFDLDTAGRVEELAAHWEVSRTEAVRRAIRATADREKPRNREALKALRKLWAQPPARTDKEREAWIREIRLMRQASTRHMLKKFERARKAPASGPTSGDDAS